MTFEQITLEDKQCALQELSEVKRLFASRGWFPGTSGNLSIRVGSSRRTVRFRHYCKREG